MGGGNENTPTFINNDSITTNSGQKTDEKVNLSKVVKPKTDN